MRERRNGQQRRVGECRPASLTTGRDRARVIILLGRIEGELQRDPGGEASPDERAIDAVGAVERIVHAGDLAAVDLAFIRAELAQRVASGYRDQNTDPPAPLHGAQHSRVSEAGSKGLASGQPTTIPGRVPCLGGQGSGFFVTKLRITSTTRQLV